MKIRDLQKKFEKEHPEIVEEVNNDIAFQVGCKVELLRSLRGLTQKELAKRAGTSQSSIARLEAGSTLPSLSFLMRIAKALEAHISTPSFIYTNPNNPNKHAVC